MLNYQLLVNFCCQDVAYKFVADFRPEITYFHLGTQQKHRLITKKCLVDVESQEESVDDIFIGFTTEVIT